MAEIQQRTPRIWVISLVAVGFGLLTIKSGGAVLFGDEAALTAAGNYVPFVLWFNFISGFAYVAAGVGLWLQRPWAVWLAVAITTAIVVTFVALGVHIYSGGLYEQRTVVAMGMRTLVWTVITLLAALPAMRRG